MDHDAAFVAQGDQWLMTIITDTAVVYQAVWNVERRCLVLVITFVVAAAVVTEWMMDGFTMTFTVDSWIV